MPLRISSISVKNSGSEDQIQLKNVTILVGPSNSGKSELLRNISMWLRQPLAESNMIILSKINDIELPNSDEIDSFLAEIGSKHNNDDEIRVSIPVINYQYKDMSDVPPDHVIKITELKNSIQKGFPHFRKKIDSLSYNDSELNKFSRFLNMYSLMLDAKTRFTFVEDKAMGDLLAPALNYMVKLYHDDVAREEISKIMKDEFDNYFYLIPYKGNIKILLDKKHLKDPKDLNEENINFFKNSKSISEFSDGTKAFLGMLLAINSITHKIILIDDPEAFLHPPLSKNLGRYFSKSAVDGNGSLFVSTHSVDFLMGCLEETKEITIIRLTYDGIKGTVSNISYNEISNIMRNPLLRSNNVLDALFHKFAIVVEGNSDRIFYNEINLKMLELNRAKAITDPIFINSIGKQVIHQIISPLKQIKIPAVSIYDFDIFDERKNNKGLFNIILKTNNIAKKELEKYLNLQEEMQRFVIQNHKNGEPDPYRRIGASYFPENLRCDILRTMKELKQYGIFINPYGTLEKWLQTYEITGEKNEWLVKILDKIMNISTMPSGDVWSFMQDIRLYIEQHGQ